MFSDLSVSSIVSCCILRLFYREHCFLEWYILKLRLYFLDQLAFNSICTKVQVISVEKQISVASTSNQHINPNPTLFYFLILSSE